jgi:hypothetical protein
MAVTGSTETPAEQIAGDIALAIYQGDIGPGRPLPSRERLMSSYDVPPPTVERALQRLFMAGISTYDGGALVASGPAGDDMVAVMAAAAMCRRLAVAASGPGPIADPEVLHAASEQFLAAARRGLPSGRLADDDVRLAGPARELLQAGHDLARSLVWGTAPASRHSPREPGGRTRVVLAGDGWPASARDGVTAAAARGPARRAAAPGPRPAARGSRSGPHP